MLVAPHSLYVALAHPVSILTRLVQQQAALTFSIQDHAIKVAVRT